MSYFGNGRDSEKIFRGAYTYLRNTNIYSEETFEVFRDKKEMTYTFVSEMVSRVSTGELLNIKTTYVINKNYTPVHVEIERSLGNQRVYEIYDFDQKKNKIHYTFKDNDGEEKTDIVSTSPKFFITTSATCMSMGFIKSKKFDPNGKNYYNIWTSTNMWEYEKPPKVKSIIVQRISPTSENLKVGDSNLEAVQYKITEQYLSQNEDSDEEAPPPPAPDAPAEELRVWLSHHMTIPYLIKSQDGTQVKVKYLNNLDKDQ